MKTMAACLLTTTGLTLSLPAIASADAQFQDSVNLPLIPWGQSTKVCMSKYIYLTGTYRWRGYDHRSDRSGGRYIRWESDRTLTLRTGWYTWTECLIPASSGAGSTCPDGCSDAYWQHESFLDRDGPAGRAWLWGSVPKDAGGDHVTVFGSRLEK